MSTATATRMTAEEFQAFVERPENANKFLELVRGEVIELPPPVKPHCAASFNVGFELGLYARRVRGRLYVLGNDCGVILRRAPDTVVGPDVAVYDDAGTFAELHPKYGEVVPLLAVEVRSPSDRTNPLLAKIRDYLESGVKVVWLVDPDDRTVSAHRPGLPTDVFRGDDEITGYDVLPGFACRVCEFFRLPGEAVPAKSEVP